MYYEFMHPETGVLKRQSPATLEANRKFSGSIRETLIKIIEDVTQKALKEGDNNPGTVKAFIRDQIPMNDLLKEFHKVGKIR